jgi:hypothetical protein
MAGDADFVADRELVEVKCTIKPRDVATRAVQQLFVYAARLRPTAAAMLLPRQHTLVRFELSKHTDPLAELDAEICAAYAIAPSQCPSAHASRRMSASVSRPLGRGRLGRRLSGLDGSGRRRAVGHIRACPLINERKPAACASVDACRSAWASSSEPLLHQVDHGC